MTHFRDHRWTRTILLAAYLLATTAAGAFHNHGPAEGCHGPAGGEAWHTHVCSHAGHEHADGAAIDEHSVDKHADRECTGDECGDRVCSHADHEHQHSHDDADAERAPAKPTGDSIRARLVFEDCPACRFLALSSTTAERPRLLTRGEVVAELSVSEPRHDTHLLEFALSARGPPRGVSL